MAENNKAKKICIAIHGLSHAGAERVAASWANYLVERGHDVFILVYACSERTYNLDEKVHVIPLAETNEEYSRLVVSKRLLRMRAIIRQEKPQIVISFLPRMQINMMLATLGMRMKRVETVRNNPWMDKDVVGKRFLWDLCFKRSHAIIVQTKEQASYFPNRLQAKCVEINNPVSEEFVRQSKIYTDGYVRRFVAVARLNPQKNYSMMVRAFAQATQGNAACTLDIYGAGAPEKVQELETLIAELGMENQIRLCGWRKDIHDLLTSYDAFLMSSNYEGMPNALAEAMATGLVCLSTDCKTGPKDMIDHGESGFLAKTGDVQSFAEGIRKISQLDKQQCNAISAAAREKILAMCSKENTLDRLVQLIESDL